MARRTAPQFLRFSAVGDDPRWLPTASEPQQVVRRGMTWAWDNRGRAGIGHVVYQETLSGTCWLRTPAGTQVVGPGLAMLFAHGEDSAYGRDPALDEPYVCRWVSMTGAGLGQHWDWLRRRSGSVVRTDPGTPVRLAADRLFAALADRASAPAASRAIHDLVAAIEVMGAHDRREDLTVAERTAEEIAEDPFQPWSLKLLAARRGVTREHLVRTFSVRFDQPPARWLAARRLERARQLLGSTDLTVAAVAAQVGLRSAHALARLVRRGTGQGPNMLRRQLMTK